MQQTQISYKKNLARDKAKLFREQLHKKHRDTAPKKLLNFVPDMLKNFKCSIVAGFMPIFTEINITPLMRELAAKGCDLCLPVTSKGPNILLFRSYTFGQELEDGPYKTKQPGESSSLVFPDIVLIPLLAFDREFNRLGYGGGYYDRTISEFRKSRQKVSFIGVAYSQQGVEKIPTTSSDEPMDGILTPSGLDLHKAWVK